MKTFLSLLLGLAIASGAAHARSITAGEAGTGRIGASWAPVYGFPPIGPDRFMPKLRALGGGFSRVTLYWTQLEPTPGKPRWDELDAYLGQLDAPEEGMITLASASPWATRTKAAIFPSSPARDPQTYYAFVRRVVEHCAGRVRYFQADTEPSNRFFWAGTAEEYAAEQRIFYRAVKDADPKAVVVLGGSDGLFDPTGQDPLPNQQANLAFLDTVLRDANGAYDMADLHLYADPYTIPARVAWLRAHIRANGGDRPIMTTETSGPGFFEFKGNRRYAAAFFGPGAGPDAIRKLRQSLDTLPPEARMFLDTPGSPANRHLLRVQIEDLVIRNVLALSAGVERIAWFDIWHDDRDPDASHDIINSPAGLFERDGSGLTGPTPLGAVFARVAGALGRARTVMRLDVPGEEGVEAYRVVRRHAPAVLIAWRRPPQRGATLAPRTVRLPWRSSACTATMADGTASIATCRSGGVTLSLTDMPVFITGPH